jgi:DNA-binding XRE family transcriptional regulator
MIVPYHAIIMAATRVIRCLVRAYRQERGWSQAELAQRAGISRTAVSAIEGNRLVPSVIAALSLARTFGCTVESLFGTSSGERKEPTWAWPPTSSPCRLFRYPVEAVPAEAVAHDGVFQDGLFIPSRDDDPETTLVLACCDPAVALLAAEYARQALSLLGQGDYPATTRPGQAC